MESQSDLFLQRVYDTGVGVRQWLADGVRDCRRYSGNHPFWLAVYLGWYMCVSTHTHIYIYTLCTWPWICYIMIRPGTWWLNDGIAMVQGRRVQKPRDASNFTAAIHSCWWFSWGVILIRSNFCGDQNPNSHSRKFTWLNECHPH